MLPYEVKVSVIKVFSGMGDEPIWKGNQEGVDTLAESEGGFLVWPKYLMEEVLGENRVLKRYLMMLLWSLAILNLDILSLKKGVENGRYVETSNIDNDSGLGQAQAWPYDSNKKLGRIGPANNKAGSVPLDWTLGAFILQTMVEPVVEVERNDEHFGKTVGNEAVIYLSVCAVL
ncbi:hypothetical protein LguiA_021434 [Lonicera macranthoides]